MRKILLTLILVIVLLITGLVIVKGFSIAGRQVCGVTQIAEKDEEIDGKNEELDKLISGSYNDSSKKLDESAKKMKAAKEEYENQAVLLGNDKYYSQTTYKLEFLYIKFGKYEKENNVNLKVDFVNSQVAGRYDLNFTVIGKYAKVADFIYDIENDSKLGFKIENFSMGPQTEVSTESTTINGVKATFTCKEIRIDLKKIESSNTESTENTEGQENGTESDQKANNTSNVSTNTESNTINTTNTTNAEDDVTNSIIESSN